MPSPADGGRLHDPRNKLGANGELTSTSLCCNDLGLPTLASRSIGSDLCSQPAYECHGFRSDSAEESPPRSPHSGG
jgi:hypothetical protein